MKALISYFLFPGFLFGAVMGLLAGWVDRKVTARIHYRVGPPWYQNFVDIVKLFIKEVIVPERSRTVFLLAPLVGLVSVTLAASFVGTALIDSASSFPGDVIVILYVLSMPAIAAIIGAAASGNPLASVGASREIKMLISYELPFILAIVSVIIKSDSIRLSQIIAHQAQAGSFIFSWSGISAFLVAIFCMQAKLGFVPFDAAEAEQEIMGGTLIEYSGFPLALFRLTKAMLLYTLPLFLISLFWGCTLGWAIIAKYIILLVGIILIKNTNPRLRIDQAMRWFWGPMTILAVLSVVLAVGGL